MEEGAHDFAFTSSLISEHLGSVQLREHVVIGTGSCCSAKRQPHQKQKAAAVDMYANPTRLSRSVTC